MLNIYSRLKNEYHEKNNTIYNSSYSTFVFAQQPKLNLKLIGGINTNSFIYQVEGVSAEMFTGWQVGAGVRVIKTKSFSGV